jgi:hypothetical protein
MITPNHDGQDGLDRVDAETARYLARMAEEERVLANRVPGVRTVLVVLSSVGMVYDLDSLRLNISRSYSDAVTFFVTTDGTTLGASCPSQLDLLVDLTGPGQRQCLLYARKLRKISRMTVGRNAGFFRKKIYDRVYDERAKLRELPVEKLARERVVQKAVFDLAGVSFLPSGNTPMDRGKLTPMELPPFAKL